MIAKKYLVFIATSLVIVLGGGLFLLYSQDTKVNNTVPRAIENPLLRMELVQVKQMTNVVTMEIAIENRQDKTLVINHDQVLLSIEPYYQDHVHAARVIKTLDYESSNSIPPHSLRHIMIEFDVNHEITSDYYLLYSPEENFSREDLYYSLDLS
ncbi:MAG: hypothetical protein ACRCWD_07290 [Culicoidibacterales bacterium]